MHADYVESLGGAFYEIAAELAVKIFFFIFLPYTTTIFLFATLFIEILPTLETMDVDFGIGKENMLKLL